MLDDYYDLDSIEEELKNLHNHLKEVREFQELVEEYGSIEEALENKDIGSFREAAENSPLTNLYASIDQELQDAYDAADWT